MRRPSRASWIAMPSPTLPKPPRSSWLRSRMFFIAPFCAMEGLPLSVLPPRHALLHRGALAADVGVVAGPHTRVDHDDVAVLHGAHTLRDRAPQLVGIRHRPDALGALRHRQHRQVDVGLVDPLTAPLVLDRPTAQPRD